MSSIIRSSQVQQVGYLAKKAIKSPQKIYPYLRKRIDKLRYDVRYRNLMKQKELIHEFVEQDSFALVILDSCRMDYFQDEIDSYLTGDLNRVYTPVTATIDYTRTTWTDYYDLNYVTAMPAPTDHAFERKDLRYRPTDHISDFTHVWRDSQNQELGSVTPEELTEQALQKGGEKMVVHYAQPHAPYIGEKRLRGSENSIEWGESLQEIYKKMGRYNLQDKTIPDEELRAAYRSNLQRVLASVQDLVAHLDRPIVITADHGELLGEDGRYIHGGKRHPHLCEVPWFTVDESIMGDFKKDTDYDSSSEKVTEQEVEEQLKNLGYM